MTKIRRTALLCAGTVAGAVFAFAPAAQAEKFTFKIASGHGTSFHFVQLAQSYFIPEVKKRVKERTNHEVELVEGWAGSMVKPTEVLEGLQTGIIDIGVYCVCHEANKLPLQNIVMYLPFQSSNQDVSVKVLRKMYAAFPEFNQQLEGKYGQKNLAVVPYEDYGVVSRAAAKGVSDFKGKKVGAAGPNSFWVENAGALPIMVLGPDMYTSFQSGLIDGMLIAASAMEQLKLYDVAPYFVDMRFGAPSHIVINVSQRRFGRLPQEIQDILVEVGRDTEARAAAFSKDYTDRYADIIRKAGTKVVAVEESHRKEWAQALEKAVADTGKRVEAESKLPVRKAMQAYIEETEKQGYVWPVRYKLD